MLKYILIMPILMLIMIGYFVVFIVIPLFITMFPVYLGCHYNHPWLGGIGSIAAWCIMAGASMWYEDRNS